jgi:MFS family permease
MKAFEVRAGPGTATVLGLAANWRQVALLVAVTAFVGGMVGMERSILPLMASSEFGVASKAAAVSFIVSFGLAKAVANLLAGHMAQRFTRRRMLIAGWLFGVPVPFVLIWAPDWGWVIGANVLLGVNQGLTWSMTVNMKADLVGLKHRGLVMGLNESAGYLTVALVAFLTGVIAEAHGLRPEPFYLGVGLAAVGLALSAVLVRDTSPFVAKESARQPKVAAVPSLRSAFADATWRRPALVGATQAGFVKNLNDGLAWGIFPLMFADKGLPLDRIGLLSATYPLVWGALQIPAGWASDRLGRKPLIVGGMLVQAIALALAGLTASFETWLIAVVLLGVGTALVYPTLLAAVGDAVPPEQRAPALGVYRFWRDMGAACGALAAGILADAFGFGIAIQAVAALTAASGVFAATALRKPAARVLSYG